MIQQLLSDIGLSDKESAMYIALLRHGEQPISFLAKKVGFNRGTGYVILHSLLEKGLVTKSTKKDVNYFAPLDPEQLITYLEHRKQKIESDKTRVKAMMEQLTAIANPNAVKPKIKFFEGAEGARTVLEDTLSSHEKVLHAYQSISDVIDFAGADFFEDYTNRRIQTSCVLYAIQTRDKDKKAFDLDPRSRRHTTSKKELREIRYASEDMAFPMTMYIYDNKLAVISSKEEGFSLIIESRELAEMQKKIFGMMWNSMDRGRIKVGILHSLSGTMALSEKALVDATLMAIDEINEKGGILGKNIEPIVVDGASDPEKFKKEAEILIKEEGVVSVFGGWTSASRKMMKPVFEKYNHLLWYATQYEGLEESSNIIYLGAAPNQQILPAVDFAIKNIGNKFFLVGSDYVFPRSANEIMKAQIKELGGEIVGEEYKKLGASDFKNIVEKIKKNKPDVILNTINGDSNISFFEQLREAGISSKTIPTISFSIAEEEISHMDIEIVRGDYAAWNYFQSLKSDGNKKFVEAFKEKYGKHRVTDDPIEASYSRVYLFAEAVKKAGTDEVKAIREAVKGLSFDAPGGTITIDPGNQHAYKTVRIGQIEKDGQFKIVWDSNNQIKPVPYPEYKSKKGWNEFLTKLYKNWGGRWAK
ncbi:MAG: urea ABC transporter substrate-binding protein [Candidatus Gracilibacteria bacterium]|jgi:urea transport system substrate-binding protein